MVKTYKIGKLDAYKRMRKVWLISPVTRVKKSKKKPNRAKSNQNTRKELDEL